MHAGTCMRNKQLAEYMFIMLRTACMWYNIYYTNYKLCAKSAKCGNWIQKCEACELLGWEICEVLQVFYKQSDNGIYKCEVHGKCFLSVGF